jgi:hypothetical protein
MNVVFNSLMNRIATGSEWFSSSSINALLVSNYNITPETNLEDLTPFNVISDPLQLNNKQVIVTPERTSYDADDVTWLGDFTAGGVVLVDDENKPLIYIDFGFNRVSRNGSNAEWQSLIISRKFQKDQELRFCQKTVRIK